MAKDWLEANAKQAKQLAQAAYDRIPDKINLESFGGWFLNLKPSAEGLLAVLSVIIVVLLLVVVLLSYCEYFSYGNDNCFSSEESS